MKLHSADLDLAKIPIGELSINIPSGYFGFFFDADGGSKISKEWNQFLRQSPERTVYHAIGYMEFAAHQNGWGGLLCVEKQGQPYFALPVHPASGGGVTTGYSGVLFPVCENDRQLRARVSAFVELLNANHGLDFEIIQSAQAVGWNEISRRKLISAEMASAKSLRVFSCFSRIIDIGRFDVLTVNEIGEIPELESMKSLLLTFDGDARNQIRNALRNGLTVKSFDLGQSSERDNFFDVFVPIHESSWTRTGMKPHSRSYFESLSTGIASSEGDDIGVVVYLGDQPIAAVNVHNFEGRSVYWSGCSTEIGKEMNGNPLALLGGMVAAQMKGAKLFELGRFYPSEKSDKEIAITAYKRQFGGQIHSVFVSKKYSMQSLVWRTVLSALSRSIKKVWN